MKYKKNLSQVIERNKKLWSGDYTKKVLAKIDIDGLSTMRLWEEVLSPENCPNYKKMFEVFEKNFSKREFLLDDATPTARPNIGDYAFGAYLGAEIVFTKTGGYSKPIINNITDIKKLSFNKNNVWIKWLIEATKYFSEKSSGRFATSLIETMDSLNFVENIYGPKAYIEIIDNPGQCLKLFDFALDFNIQLIEEQRKFIKKHNNGYFDLHEEWLPGDCIWLSVDSWGNCGIDTFKKYGREHLQKIVNHFGGGWLHMHSSHLHLLEEIVKIKNIVGIGILDDPKHEKCFRKLRSIQEITRNIPLQINCEKSEFLNQINNNILPRNVMYWVDSGVKDVDEANKIMEMVYYY